MSMEALLLGVRDHLRTAVTADLFGEALSDKNCDVQPDGRPDPSCGLVYVSIHPGPIRQTDANGLSMDESYGVFITLTLRTGYVPQDRIGAHVVTKPILGLMHRARVIRRKVSMNYTPLDYAGGAYASTAWTGGREYSIAATKNGFIEPLRFKTAGVPEPKGAEWFWAVDEGDGVPAPAGVAVTLTFDDARRVQRLDDDTD